MNTPTSMPTMPQTTVITANWRTTLSLYVDPGGNAPPVGFRAASVEVMAGGIPVEAIRHYCLGRGFLRLDPDQVVPARRLAWRRVEPARGRRIGAAMAA